MRSITFVMALTLLTATAAAAQAPDVIGTPAPNTLGEEEKAAGFKLLFDGKAATDWRGYRQKTLPDGWTVADGALALAGKGEGLGSSDIVTRDEYANFELRLQWRIAKDGNSGIMYRVSEEYEAPYESGPEMQVLDDAGHADGKSRLTAAGSCFGLYPAPAGIVKPAGEWNDIRIIANGAHVEHWLNGVKVVDVDRTSETFRAAVAASKFKSVPGFGEARRGRILLQDHGDEVWFRNIRIRALEAQ